MKKESDTSEYEFIATEDIPLFRGKGGTDYRPLMPLVQAKSFTVEQEHAALYGEVFNYKLKKGSKVFIFDALRKHDQDIVPLQISIVPEHLKDWLIERGYDALKNTNTRGVEYFALNEDAIEGIEQDYHVDYTPVPKGRYLFSITNDKGDLISAQVINEDQIPEVEKRKLQLQSIRTKNTKEPNRQK